MAEILATYQGLVRATWVPLGLAFAGIAAMTALERVAPAEVGHGLAGRLRNLGHAFVFHALGLAGLAVWLVHGPRLSGPASAPAPLAAAGLALAHLFAIDFVYYWYHRAQHRHAWLWSIHALHHADAELNATSSFRTYWFELPLQAVVVTSPALWLFGDQGPIHAAGVTLGSYAFLIFSHCNLRLHLGPLTGLVCGPQVHRIHHSRLPAHRDRNFAQYFPFLDRLFGTYHAPGRDEFPPTGVEELASDASIASALVRPVRLALRGMKTPSRERNPAKGSGPGQGQRKGAGRKKA